MQKLSSLTNLGAADEVGEIIIELQGNIPASNRLLKRAVEAKLMFSADDVIEFLCTNDKKLATAALYNSAGRLRDEDMEALYGYAHDDDIIAICAEWNLVLPEELRLKEHTEDDDSMYEYVPERPRRLGILGALAVMLGFKDAAEHSHMEGRGGRCTGDCENCPPHYGYRYGRWYFGHGHMYGCEFGGNKGRGDMD